MRIERNLLEPVAAWATASYHRFNPNGPGRQYGILQRPDLDPPSEAWTIKQKIVDEFGLSAARLEPLFKDYCGFITEGGAIHRHIDPNLDGKIHTRFNVMIAKPAAGGVPVQAGVEIQVEEGDVWRCDAGLVEHWCTPVVGPRPRIVLSYGFLL